MSRSQRERRQRASRRRHAAAEVPVAPSVATAGPSLHDVVAPAAAAYRRLPHLVALALVGALWGGLVGWAARVPAGAAALGAVGGASIALRDRWAAALGRRTALVAVGLVWAVLLAAAGAAAGAREPRELVALALGGLGMPVLFVLLSRPLAWAGPAVRAAGRWRAAVAARWRDRHRGPTLFDRPLQLDPLVWLAAAGAAAAAAAVRWRWGPTSVAVLAVAGPAAAAVRLARRNGRRTTVARDPGRRRGRRPQGRKGAAGR